jgi:uncharacterized membrane protein YjjP (DUF1212 family)
MLAKLFGANWQTSLWGFITLICGAIALYPQSVAFLPDNIETWVKGIAGFVTVIAGGAFVTKVKDKNVTGGSVQQTLTGAPVTEGQQNLVDATLLSTPSKDLEAHQQVIKAQIISEKNTP